MYSSVSNITRIRDTDLLDILETSLGYNVAVSAIIAASPTINDTPNLYDGYSGRHSITSDDFQSGGRVNQFGAQAFTSYLNTINYAGSNQWVLPSACINPPQSVNNQTNSQFGEQFYSELGGTIGSIIPTNSKFTNEQASSYWLGTEAEPGSAGTTNTVFFYNHQRADVKTEHMYAWAVSPGNVAVVPVPAAVWLFDSGLIGLVGLKRRGNSG